MMFGVCNLSRGFVIKLGSLLLFVASIASAFFIFFPTSYYFDGGELLIVDRDTDVVIDGGVVIISWQEGLGAFHTYPGKVFQKNIKVPSLGKVELSPLRFESGWLSKKKPYELNPTFIFVKEGYDFHSHSGRLSYKYSGVAGKLFGVEMMLERPPVLRVDKVEGSSQKFHTAYSKYAHLIPPVDTCFDEQFMYLAYEIDLILSGISSSEEKGEGRDWLDLEGSEGKADCLTYRNWIIKNREDNAQSF